MALPVTFILAVQYVWVIFLWQTAFSGKDMEHICQQLLVIAPLKATLQRAFELACVSERVFHALHWLIRSSALLAS